MWALAEFLYEREYYHGLAKFYDDRRKAFVLFRCLRGAPFQFRYDTIAGEHDADSACRMTREAGVAWIEVPVFVRDREDNPVLRFCLARSEATLARGAADCVPEARPLRARCTTRMGPGNARSSHL